MRLTTTSLVAVAIAVALTGCYEGGIPGGPATRPANATTPGVDASTLRLISSNPVNNSSGASLTGEITFVLSEPLDPASVSSETVQLIPSVADSAHAGHGMGAGSANALNSTLISLLGPDSGSLNYDLITPGATVKGFIRPGADDRTIVFTPNNQLMPGMKYEIALHGLRTKKIGPISEHFVPLTFTTASAAATRLIHKEGVVRTSVLTFEADGHTVTRYPGDFPPGTDIPTSVTPDRLTKHDTILPGASNFIAARVDSLRYEPVGTLKHYTADIMEGGPTVLGSGVFVDPGLDKTWGNADDHIHTYSQSSGNMEKLFFGTNGLGWPFADRNDPAKFALHDINIMVYDGVNARSMFKHIWFTAKGLSDAEKQATAAPGVVLAAAIGSVRDYHDYRYGTGVTNNGKLLARMRVYPTPNMAPFSSTDTVKYCRQYSYNVKGQLVQLMDYTYKSPNLPQIPGPTETCPISTDRTLLFYTLNEYDPVTGISTKVTAKRPSGPQPEPTATDVEMYVIYFSPN